MTPTRNTAPHGVWTCWPMVACIISTFKRITRSDTMNEQQIADLKLVIQLLEYMMMAQTIKMQPKTHAAYMRLAADVHKGVQRDADAK